MRTRGDARSVGGAVVRGVLRAAVLVTLGVIALLFTRDEPLGNRVLLGSISALMFAVAGWGVIETRRELRRPAATLSVGTDRPVVALGANREDEIWKGAALLSISNV